MVGRRDGSACLGEGRASRRRAAAGRACGRGQADGGKGEGKSPQHLKKRAVLIREVLYDTAVEKGKGELYLPSNLSLALLAHFVLFAGS